MDNTIEQIFYSQAFRAFLVLFMGISSYLYLEGIKKIGFKGKYALIIGISILFFGALISVTTYSFNETISILTLTKDARFFIEKPILAGYAFVVYASLDFIKNLLKKLLI